MKIEELVQASKIMRAGSRRGSERDEAAWLVADALTDHRPIDRSVLESVGFTGGHEYETKNGFTYMELHVGGVRVTVSEVTEGDDWSCEEWIVYGEPVPGDICPHTIGHLWSLLLRLHQERT